MKIELVTNQPEEKSQVLDTSPISHVNFHSDIEEQKAPSLENLRHFLIWFEESSLSAKYSDAEKIGGGFGFGFGAWASMSAYYLTASLISSLIGGRAQQSLSIISGWIAQIATGSLIAVPTQQEVTYLIGRYQGKLSFPGRYNRSKLRTFLNDGWGNIFGAFSGQPFISLLQEYLGKTGFLGIAVPYIITPVVCYLICRRATINLFNKMLAFSTKDSRDEIEARQFFEKRLFAKARALNNDNMTDDQVILLFVKMSAPTMHLENIFEKFFLLLDQETQISNERLSSCGSTVNNILGYIIGLLSCAFLLFAALDSFNDKVSLKNSFTLTLAILTSIIAFLPNGAFYGIQTQKRMEDEFFAYKTGNCELTLKGSVAQGFAFFSSMAAVEVTLSKALSSSNVFYWFLVPFAFAGPSIARALPLKKVINLFIDSYNAMFHSDDPKVMRKLLYNFIQYLQVNILLFDPKLMVALHKAFNQYAEKKSIVSSNPSTLFYPNTETVAQAQQVIPTFKP